tara:strand:+ start:20272 stop:20706 length:435 start_codon:yes stop_codon:yes gene_type:complete
MEYNKVQQVLDAYFEGDTSLQEEIELRKYFNSDVVDKRLIGYIPLFKALIKASVEVSSTTIKIPKTSNTFIPWWLSSAALIVSILGVAGFINSSNTRIAEQQQALAALKQSKNAMILLANQFNRATETLSLVNQFHQTKSKYLK